MEWTGQARHGGEGYGSSPSERGHGTMCHFSLTSMGSLIFLFDPKSISRGFWEGALCVTRLHTNASAALKLTDL